MTLSDRLDSAKPSVRGTPCRIAVIMDALSDRDRDALVAALSVPKGDPARLSNVKIAEALKSEGYGIHYKSVETHRKGACRCESGR